MPREPIWLRPEAAGTGRPAEWSRASIADAAVAVAERAGFKAVTMRRVAAELGTGAASLYRYVADRTELLELMTDRVYGELELRRIGPDWRADLVATMLESLRVMRRHPWFADLLAELPMGGGPAGARLIEHCLEILSTYPAPGWRKMEIIGVLGGMVQQYVVFTARQDVPALIARQATYLLHVAQDGEHPHIAAAFAEPHDGAGQEDAAQTLGRLLPLVLDGLLGA